MTLVRRVLFTVALVLPVAAAPADAPPTGWTGKGELGYVVSRGNSDADSVNAKLDSTLHEAPWTDNLYLYGLYGRSAGVTSTEQWDSRWQTNYAIDGSFYFGSLRYQVDKFSGFQYQASATAGLGHKFLDSDATHLSAQLGAGVRALRPETLIKDDRGAIIQRIEGERGTQAVATAGLDYDHSISATTKLTDKLITEAGAGNTSVENDAGVQVKVRAKLALALNLSVHYNTSPPTGTKTTDVINTANLVYSF